MSRTAWSVVAAAVAAATLAVLGVVLLPRSGARTSGTATGRGAAATPPTLGVARTRLGQILVDGRGRSLYAFLNDSRRRSRCTGGCTRVWPPAVVAGELRVGRGVTASKVSTIRRGDGSRQLVYNGHPLYSLTADSRPGDTSGQAFQGAWFVVSPTGRAVIPRGATRRPGY